MRFRIHGFSWLNATCHLLVVKIRHSFASSTYRFLFSYGKSHVDKTKILAGYWKIQMFAKNLEFNFAAFLDNAKLILVAKIHIFLRFFSLRWVSDFDEIIPMLDAKVQIFAAGIPVELLLESEFGCWNQNYCWWNFNYVQFVGEILNWNLLVTHYSILTHYSSIVHP